jgi:DNA ligase-1
MADYYCTLAKTYNPDKHNVVGWSMSEKLDGVRALWCPKRQAFFSRSNKPLIVPPSWYEAMRAVTVPLDGEFWMGKGRFQDTVSAVRKKAPTEEQFVGVGYWVFDAPVEGPFLDRLHEAAVAVADLDQVRMLPQRMVQDLLHLERYYRYIRGLGGEGVMIRNPDTPYEYKRTANLLKWKGSIDGKATVSEEVPGTGKHEGRMGALWCEMFRGTTLVKFKVGTGFTDAERERCDWVGKVIRWDAHEWTRDGKPRHPSFRCIDEGD